jgi:AcrR family transcriptional regulator
VATALFLADNEGFDAVTMRRVASELGLGTMSLYWYVESRDDLLDLMFDDIMAEQLLPEPVPADWRDGLRAIAAAARQTHQRHPWLVSRIGERPSFGPNMLHHAEQSLACVGHLDIDPESKMAALSAIDDYVIGHMIRSGAQQDLYEKSGMSAGDWSEAVRPYVKQVLAEGDFPHLSKMADADDGFDSLTADTFDLGLEMVLDGIELRVGKTTAKPRTSAKGKRKGSA